MSPTSATLTGSVDLAGQSTTWYFEYGTSTRYGSRTPTRSVRLGLRGAKRRARPLTGLTPGTTYHYRLVATSDAGTSRGADAAFTTVGVTLATPALRVVYGRGITLSGSVPVKRAGEAVTVFAQPFGEGSFRSIATVLTAADGTWRYRREAADPHVVPGELERRQERGDRGRRPARRLASPDCGRPAVDARRGVALRSPAASSSSSGGPRRAGGSPSSVCA